jgi:hypothetical protein
MERRLGTVTAVVLAMLSLTGCGASGSPEPDSARGRVESLERALVEADGAALVRVVKDPSHAISTALLTESVLSEGALADQDVDIETTDKDLETLSFALRVPDDEPTPWLEPQLRRTGEFVKLPLPSVKLEGQGVTSVRIGGATVRIDPLPPEGKVFYLPPGEYDVGAGGADRYVDHGPTQNFDTREYGVDRLGFIGELTAAGRARVDRAVAAFVRRCTKPLRGSRPVSCPLRKAFVGGLDFSEWTLESKPRIAIDATSDGWSVSTPDPPVGRMRGVIKDRTTGVTEHVRDTVPFAVNGTISVRGDDLVIHIAG